MQPSCCTNGCAGLVQLTQQCFHTPHLAPEARHLSLSPVLAATLSARAAMDDSMRRSSATTSYLAEEHFKKNGCLPACSSACPVACLTLWLIWLSMSWVDIRRTVENPLHRQKVQKWSCGTWGTGGTCNLRSSRPATAKAQETHDTFRKTTTAQPGGPNGMECS